MKTLRILLFALAAAAPPIFAQETRACHHADGHHAGVDARGDQVMGFDHAKTTHHFLLTASGGVIDVSANDPADTASRDAIRSHLEHIAKMFAAGDFEAPMLIHGRVPPGVPEMKRDGKQIAWTYEPTPAGGRVVATTKNPADIAAIHDFLRFQIEDHRTGDPTDAPKP
jgi:hypothetical protein